VARAEEDLRLLGDDCIRANVGSLGSYAIGGCDDNAFVVFTEYFDEGPSAHAAGILAGADQSCSMGSHKVNYCSSWLVVTIRWFCTVGGTYDGSSECLLENSLYSVLEMISPFQIRFLNAK